MRKIWFDYLNIYAIEQCCYDINWLIYISAQDILNISSYCFNWSFIKYWPRSNLIFTLNLGVKGAMIATIISQGVSALLIIVF